MFSGMENELTIARRIADGTLPSPQQFGNSWFWLIRVSGTGVAWRQAVGEFCLREKLIWLADEMVARAVGLPVLIDHPIDGMLTSTEFASRCVGITTFAFVRGDDLMAIARILDAGANALLATGEIDDTSPACVFERGSGQRIDVDGKLLFIEPDPVLLDHICLTARGVWRRDGSPGVETTEELEA